MSAPNTNVQTINKIFYKPYESAEVSAFVGHFERGPIDLPIYISNVDQFKFLFGRGIGEYHQDWYQVYNFLQYSSGIWVTRTSGLHKTNANSVADTSIVFNLYDEWNTLKDTLTTSNITFYAKTPGIWGNLLSVAIINKEDYNNNVVLKGTVKAQDIFTFFEDDYTGIIAFRNNTVIEKYYDEINNLDRINDESLYLHCIIDNTVNNLSFHGENIITLSEGWNSYPEEADFKRSYDVYSDSNLYNIDILIGNQRANEMAIDFADKNNCIAFIGLPTVIITRISITNKNGDKEVLYGHGASVLGFNKLIPPSVLNGKSKVRIKKYIDSLPRSKNVHFTMNMKEQYDVFSNKIKLVNIAGDAAGLKAQASLISPWSVAAGLERGIIKNLDKMHITLSRDDVEDYLEMGLNVTSRGILLTQRTFYDEDSVFTNVHISSLFNHLIKEAPRILNHYVFEENSYFTRHSMVPEFKRYLENMKVNRGIEDARIHIRPGDNDEILVDIIIKPKFVAETIQIRITNSGQRVLTELIS